MANYYVNFISSGHGSKEATLPDMAEELKVSQITFQETYLKLQSLVEQDDNKKGRTIYKEAEITANVTTDEAVVKKAGADNFRTLMQYALGEVYKNTKSDDAFYDMVAKCKLAEGVKKEIIRADAKKCWGVLNDILGNVSLKKLIRSINEVEVSQVSVDYLAKRWDGGGIQHYYFARRPLIVNSRVVDALNPPTV